MVWRSRPRGKCGEGTRGARKAREAREAQTADDVHAFAERFHFALGMFQ